MSDSRPQRGRWSDTRGRGSHEDRQGMSRVSLERYRLGTLSGLYIRMGEILSRSVVYLSDVSRSGEEMGDEMHVGTDWGEIR